MTHTYAYEDVSGADGTCLLQIGDNKVLITRYGVKRFNAAHPHSALSPKRHYWVELDPAEGCVDSDIPFEEEGPDIDELIVDCLCFLEGDLPDWAVEFL